MDYRILVNQPRTQEIFRCERADEKEIHQECIQLFTLNNDYYLSVNADDVMGPYPNMLEAFRALGHIHVKALLKYNDLFTKIEEVMNEVDRNFS